MDGPPLDTYIELKIRSNQSHAINIPKKYTYTHIYIELYNCVRNYKQNYH